MRVHTFSLSDPDPIISIRTHENELHLLHLRGGWPDIFSIYFPFSLPILIAPMDGNEQQKVRERCYQREKQEIERHFLFLIIKHFRC